VIKVVLVKFGCNITSMAVKYKKLIAAYYTVVCIRIKNLCKLVISKLIIYLSIFTKYYSLSRREISYILGRKITLLVKISIDRRAHPIVEIYLTIVIYSLFPS
jgi:hypothetical protein